MSSPPVETRVSLLEQVLAELSREVALAVREMRSASAEARQRSAELDRRFQELRETEEQRSAEADRRSAEADRRSAEADRRFQELREAEERRSAEANQRSAELDRRFQELREAEERRSAEADRRSAETDRRLHELQDRTQRDVDAIRASADRTEASSRATDKRLGELANKFGRLTEDIVAPSIPEVFARVTGSAETPESCVRARRRHRQERGRSQEFDVLAWDTRRLLVVEVRSTLAPEDVKSLLRILGEVREYLPEARKREVLGALASFHVEPSLVRSAERRGLLMLGLSSGLVEVLNRPGFKPHAF